MGPRTPTLPCHFPLHTFPSLALSSKFCSLLLYMPSICLYLPTSLLPVILLWLCCAGPSPAWLNAVLKPPVDLWEPDECAAKKKMKTLSKINYTAFKEVVLLFSSLLIILVFSKCCQESSLLHHSKRSSTKRTVRERKRGRLKRDR